MIIAAVRGDYEFDEALDSRAEIIFDLNASLLSMEEKVRRAHGRDKKLFVHLDLAEGIGKDREGVKYAKKIGVDGIISTRISIIKAAREEGLFTVQRFFVVDSQSVNMIVETVRTSKPSMIEVMPGILPKIIRRLKREVKVPIIAGGLVEMQTEIDQAMDAGATAVSTGRREFWR